MSNTGLNKDELAVLAKVLKNFETHFEDGTKVSMFDYNDDYVDFTIEYPDGDEESMALERCQLTSDKSIKELVNNIQ